VPRTTCSRAADQHEKRTKMDHPKYETTRRAINDLFGDTSVGPQTTLEALEALLEELETLIETVKIDIDE